MVNVRLAESEPDRKLCLSLRWTVFVEEQGVPPSMEVDEHDHKGAVHAIATWNGVPAATGRFVLDGKGEAKIGRMAVVDDVRGRGIGRALLAFLEEQARARGGKKLSLWAQVQARPFYEKAGYRVVSDKPFDDAGIPHVAMEKHAA
jgi:predicted GNAT family N-acyltransferase